jgi:hypothetical protein
MEAAVERFPALIDRREVPREDPRKVWRLLILNVGFLGGFFALTTRGDDHQAKS